VFLFRPPRAFPALSPLRGFLFPEWWPSYWFPWRVKASFRYRVSGCRLVPSPNWRWFWIPSDLSRSPLRPCLFRFSLVSHPAISRFQARLLAHCAFTISTFFLIRPAIFAKSWQSSPIVVTILPTLSFAERSRQSSFVVRPSFALALATTRQNA